MFQRTILSALVVAAAAGTAIAIKALNKKDKEEDDDEIHFIKINDSDDPTPTDEEVAEVSALYPYLSDSFISDMLALNPRFQREYEEDTLVTLVHTASFADAASRAAFRDILTDAGYTCEDKTELEITASKRFFVEDGAIISDVLNVANQTAALQGEYKGYDIK